MENITLGELSNRAAAEYASRELQSFEGKRETYAQAQDQIDRVARALISLGVKHGDKVSLWMTNRPEWIHVMFALAKIGAVMIPINTRFRTSDLDYVLRQSDTSTLITMENAGPVRYLDMTLELCPELHTQNKASMTFPGFPELKRVISLGAQRARGVYSWEEMLAEADKTSPAQLAERERAVRPEDTLFIMYTSGTTGFPKGVMQAHNVIRNARNVATRLKITKDDCTVMFLPIFHAFGYFDGPLVAYVTGSRMVLTEAFNASQVLGLIESEKGTLIHGFDTHWQDLMDNAEFGKRNLKSLRLGILAAGLPSTVGIAERANKNLCKTVTGWGMTEVMPGATIGSADDNFDQSTQSSGETMEGYEMKIIDPATGESLGVGKPGEMCTRGFGVMQGYYKKPDETAKSIDKDGWFHTGDMGVWRPDGYIRFLGRYKEMLKIGGENVDPIEVEAYFLKHPCVCKVQVVGVADRRLSEVAVAFVVRQPGMDVSCDELVEFAKGKVASFKIPRHYFFVDEFPMTSSGKVKKFELRELAKEKLTSPVDAQVV